MYVVVYCCATLPDQVITDPLSFEDATWLSCEMNAELLLEVSNLNPNQESFAVQPSNELGKIERVQPPRLIDSIQDTLRKLIER